VSFAPQESFRPLPFEMFGPHRLPLESRQLPNTWPPANVVAVSERELRHRSARVEIEEHVTPWLSLGKSYLTPVTGNQLQPNNMPAALGP
jgi:hypothetical protein